MKGREEGHDHYRKRLQCGIGMVRRSVWCVGSKGNMRDVTGADPGWRRGAGGEEPECHSRSLTCRADTVGSHEAQGEGKARVCPCVCVCVRTCTCVHEMTEGTGRKSAWRLEGAGRDGPGENTEAAPVGMGSRRFQEGVGRRAKTRGDASCRRQGSLVLEDQGSGVLLLWSAPSPRLGGLEEVTSPLCTLMCSICSTEMVSVPRL